MGRDRYPGLRSFEEQDHELFFGRDKEIDHLATLIISERITVLFGPSGVGKSSLINTAFSKTKQLASFLPFKIRLSIAKDDGETNVVKELTPLTIIENTLKKFIKKNFRLSFSRTEIVYDGASPRLWEFVKLFESKIRSVKPDATVVLIFDQFEEYFHYPPEIQESFNTQLAEVVHELPPKRILDWITNLKDEERTESRIEWYKQPNVKILFSIRSDKLSLMNGMVFKMPQILKNRFELKPFGDKNATEAIESPAIIPNENLKYNSPPIIIDKQVTTKTVNELSNKFGEIECTFLQIVCFYIEEKVKAYAKDKTTPFEFNNNLFQEEINISTILDKFYIEQTEKIGKESDVNFIRKIIEDNLVDNGQRTSLLANQLLSKLNNNTDLLNKLLTERLIREENTARGLTYELSHDKLIAPVEKSKNIRTEKERIERESKETAEKLRLENEEKNAELKRQKELFEVEYRLKNEALEAKAIAEQKKEEADRYRRKAKRTSVIANIFGAATIITGLFFLFESNRMSAESKQLKSNYFLANYQDEVDRHNQYYAFNFLWAADSLVNSFLTDSLLKSIPPLIITGTHIFISKDEKTIVSRKKDSVLYIWKVKDSALQVVHRFERVKDYIVSGAVNKIAVLNNSKIIIWDIERNKEIYSIENTIINNASGDALSNYMRFSYDGSKLWLADTPQNMKIIFFEGNGYRRYNNPRLLNFLNKNTGNRITTSDGFSKNGNYFIFTTRNLKRTYNLHCFDLTKNEPEKYIIKDFNYLQPNRGWEIDSFFFARNDSIYVLDINTSRQTGFRLTPRGTKENPLTGIQISGFRKYFSFPYIITLNKEQIKPVVEVFDIRFDSVILRVTDMRPSERFTTLNDALLYSDSLGQIGYWNRKMKTPILTVRQSTVIDYGFLNVTDMYYISNDTVYLKKLDAKTYFEKHYIKDFQAIKMFGNKFVLFTTEPEDELWSRDMLFSRDSISVRRLREILPYMPKEDQERHGIIKKK